MRVVVQQRQRLLRDGLATLLGLTGDLVVVGVVERGEELLELCVRSQPDVAVVDVAPEADPWPMVVALRRLLPDLVVVGVDGVPPAVDAERVRRAGVSAVVSRRDGIGAVLSAVRARGAGPPPEGVPPVPLRRGPSLTRREASVLNLLAGGRTSREISRALHVSPKTVENHKQRMFAKLGVQNQAHAVAVAIGEGMIAPDLSASVAARL